MNLLVVEDDPVSRRLVESFASRWGYEVTTAESAVKAWDILRGPNAPSLVVSDWMMPDMDGLELCRRIRAMDRPDYVYVILLTAKDSKEDIVEGLKAGADDYLAKPFHKNELMYRIRIGRRIVELEQRIRRAAETDPLTGLLNRGAFMRRLEAEMQRSRREGQALSVVLSDLDHFKRVNDVHGHQAGDEVLRQFGGLLESLSRPYDLQGRYGGEEFILCLPGADTRRGIVIAERIRERLEAEEIALPFGEGSIRISASFGVATLLSSDEDTLDSFIKRADEALYRAKAEGRNRVAPPP